MTFRDSFYSFVNRPRDAFGYFVETELTGRLTAVSLLSAIVDKSGDCTVLRIVLMRAVGAKAGAPERADWNAGRLETGLYAGRIAVGWAGAAARRRSQLLHRCVHLLFRPLELVTSPSEAGPEVTAGSIWKAHSVSR
jgi:hypothetical protein